MNKEEILKYVKNELIYKGLQLDEIGIKLENITDNINLFEKNGLNLDSVDALELIISIQKHFSIKITNNQEKFIKKQFKTPLTITNFLLELLNNKK